MAQLYYIEDGFRLETGRLKRMMNRHDVAGYDSHRDWWMMTAVHHADLTGLRG
jgi:hypothetical protein